MRRKKPLLHVPVTRNVSSLGSTYECLTASISEQKRRILTTSGAKWKLNTLSSRIICWLCNIDPFSASLHQK